MNDLSNPLVIGLLALLAGFGFVLIAKIYGLFFMNGKSPHRVGDQMTGVRASVEEWTEHQGLVSADGELWRAVSKDLLQPGDEVAVTGVDGLTLTVQRR